MALDHLNNSNLEQLALKGLTMSYSVKLITLLNIGSSMRRLHAAHVRAKVASETQSSGNDDEDSHRSTCSIIALTSLRTTHHGVENQCWQSTRRPTDRNDYTGPTLTRRRGHTHPTGSHSASGPGGARCSRHACTRRSVDISRNLGKAAETWYECMHCTVVPYSQISSSIERNSTF